jgi:hypothetical protein
LQCEDNNSCTNNSCINNTCSYPAIVGFACTSDNNSCTTDSCSSSGTCGHNSITSCLSNDGCCPTGCNSLNDNNCVQCTTPGCGGNTYSATESQLRTGNNRVYSQGDRLKTTLGGKSHEVLVLHFKEQYYLSEIQKHSLLHQKNIL